MPKLKDFYAKLKEQGKIENPEYDKFLEGLADADIPDAVVSAIDEKFFTFERASANKDIYNRTKREVLDPVDKELNELFTNQLKDYLDPLTAAELKADTNSYKKLRALNKLIPEALEKVKAKPALDEDSKRKIAEYEKNIQELTQKFSTAEKTYNEQLTHQKEESEKQFHDFRLDAELQNRGNKFTLAEAYEQNRQAITKVLMSDIKSSNVLKLGEKDGQPDIIVNDEHGKPRFNGNSPITIDSLLEEKYKPFLKQSEGGTEGQATQQQSSQQPRNQNPAVRRGASTTVG